MSQKKAATVFKTRLGLKGKATGLLTRRRRENAAGGLGAAISIKFCSLLTTLSLLQSRNLNKTNIFNHKTGEMQAV